MEEGGQGYFRLARGGGLNVFIKKFRGGQQFDCEVYFKRGSLANMVKAVTVEYKQHTVRETVILNCTILC